jgi:hypothetical protein
MDPIHTVGRIPWTGDQPCRKAATYTGQQKTDETRTSIPRLGFEPTIHVFGRTKTFHALGPIHTEKTWLGHREQA